MSGQLVVVAALIIVMVAAVAGASYVFAITAEPDREP
jgi:hypothetical protein